MTRPLILARAARLAAVLVALAISLSMAACAGSAPPSDAPVYVVNNTTIVEFAEGSSVDWNTNQGVVLSSLPIATAPTEYDQLALPAPTNGALDYIAFISPKGSERTKARWKQWGTAFPLDGKGALLPSVWPGYLSEGNSIEVKNAGGTYSMGVAYLKDNDQTVVAAYYTTITIDAGKGTWKFETPKH